MKEICMYVYSTELNKYVKILNYKQNKLQNLYKKKTLGLTTLGGFPGIKFGPQKSF